jgi:hypothetical protein
MVPQDPVVGDPGRGTFTSRLMSLPIARNYRLRVAER